MKSGSHTEKKNPVIIICTKDRPKDMVSLLTSLKAQTILPSLIIVVDGSDEPIEHVLEPFLDLNIDYVQVRPPSLPKQRNVGISRLPEDCDWVGFLDDDLVLEPNSLEMVMKNTEKDSFSNELVGMAMIINNSPYPKFNLIRGLFLLDSPKGGTFTLSGCPTMYRDINKTVEVEWLSGGVTFWKRKVFNEFKFDEWFSGTGYMEDVDFSYRVSRKYSLATCGEARCFHYHHPTPKEKLKILGTWQVTSWWYFSNKMNFSKFFVFWSLIGISINNLTLGILSPGSHRLRKFLGNLIGIKTIVRGKALLRTGFQK
ncbi:MAG: GT2 family glycosyltransferase [Bacteriovoracaceae bacterium]|jgi:GT2 family glycosyltransferase